MGIETLLLGMLPYGHTHGTTWCGVTKYQGELEVWGFARGVHFPE